MNAHDLERLGQHAKQFARTYVKLKEELQREGVPAQEASEVARAAAFMAILGEEEWPEL